MNNKLINIKQKIIVLSIIFFDFRSDPIPYQNDTDKLTYMNYTYYKVSLLYIHLDINQGWGAGTFLAAPALDFFQAAPTPATRSQKHPAPAPQP